MSKVISLFSVLAVLAVSSFSLADDAAANTTDMQNTQQTMEADKAESK